MNDVPDPTFLALPNVTGYETHSQAAEAKQAASQLSTTREAELEERGQIWRSKRQLLELCL